MSPYGALGNDNKLHSKDPGRNKHVTFPTPLDLTILQHSILLHATWVVDYSALNVCISYGHGQTNSHCKWFLLKWWFEELYFCGTRIGEVSEDRSNRMSCNILSPDIWPTVEPSWVPLKIVKETIRDGIKSFGKFAIRYRYKREGGGPGVPIIIWQGIV